MSTVSVERLGKAYKHYKTRWSRLAEWVLPALGPRHEVHWVLRDVTFSVDHGEAMAVIGANGAGKSTLLKLITGTTQSTAGAVRVDGRFAAMLELGMGFHPDFTGRQNAVMAGQLLGYTPEETAGFMPGIESFAEIGDYMDQPLRIFSSGMQVRLGFAVATARRPDLLVIDEALAVGDAHFQHKSFGRIRAFQEEGTTLLLVTHDLGAVRSICTRALWLDKGLVRAYGETREVVDAYSAFVYSQRQDIAKATVTPAPTARTEEEPLAVPGAGVAPEARDCRQDFINSTTLRNDIRVFAFDRSASKWGNGDIRITSASLEGDTEEPLRWVLGGERARVLVNTRASVDKKSVLVGFIVKDRTGQALFGDNTYLSHVDRPLSMKAGTEVRTEFEFRMPVLPRGSYVLAVAVATGSQEEHVVEEWIDEALSFESHNATTIQGLIGIPMHTIRVSTLGAPATTSRREAPPGDADQFRGAHYQRHNQRRQEHLATLGLPFPGKTVLEVGAGIGDHTGFLLDRGCRVTATDGRPDLLEVLRSRYPEVVPLVWDVETSPPAELRRYQVVYAYGLLYHTENPGLVLQHLSTLCDDFLVLETCVSFGEGELVNPVVEPRGDPTQSLNGVGCRPTRAWILNTLRRLFPHAYASRTQPWHEEFPIDWRTRGGSDGRPLSRMVFVASRYPLSEATLSPELLELQSRC